MNLRILSLSFLLFIVAPSFGQKTIEGSSKAMDVNITKDPPVLVLVEGSLKFSDVNGDNAINANEKATISFDVVNKGKGDASGLVANVRQTGSVIGLVFDKAASQGGLAPGAKKTIQIPVSGAMSLTTGTAKFVIKLEEEANFSLDEIQLDVNTLAFVTPQVKVPDYNITSDMGSTLTKKKPFDLQILVQNMGKGLAENVSAKLVIPDDVLCISDNISTTFARLNSGETKTIVYSLIVNDKYASNTIPVEIKLSERYGKYAENKTLSLQLNQTMSSAKLVVESKVKEDNSVIKEKSLSADVDKNIPYNQAQNSNTYALVIGNEDYAGSQRDLSSEANVDFARRDADVFSQYCRQTLGVPADNLTLITDATAGKMSQAIDKLKSLIKNSDGKLQVIFYYAGHGLPDENTHEPYLIPVDVSGKDLSRAIKMAEVYKSLTQFPSKGVTVFLDACFSGGGALLAARAIRIKPKEEALTGRLTVFTASSGDQTSWPYKDEQHGMFTYYLLKKLQDTKGDVNYAELGKYLNENVKFQSVKINSKEQEPQLLHSNDISDAELAKTKLKEGFK